jgi:hydroxyethylthiazole kinase
MGRLAGLGGEVRGVESIAAPDAANATASLARDLGIVAAATGARDHIASPQAALIVDNGHPMLSTVVGTGCMSTAVIGCFVAVADQASDILVATAAALAFFGVAGELAAAESDAPGSFKVALLDKLYSLTPDLLAARAKIATLEEALRAQAND